MRNVGFLGALALCTMSACTTLPVSGPHSRDLASGVVTSSTPDSSGSAVLYALVDVVKPLTDHLSDRESRVSAALPWPADKPSGTLAVSVGDTLAVTIYESRTGGLFLPVESGVRPGNFVNLPPQTVDKTGLIQVPYAGAVKVVGRTPMDIGKEISESLGYRAIEPQVVVSVTARNGSEVSVMGDVGSSRRYALNLGGERILDVIARAGGPRFPGREIFVTLQRGKSQWTIPFEELVNDPAKNINVLPEDTVYLFREPSTYQVFGASESRGGFSFTKRRMSLAEAIGQARGLDDGRADPQEVYLYRRESVQTLEDAGVSLTVAEGVEIPDILPVIYRLDMSTSGGFFLAQDFPVRDGDLIYVANAQSVELIKFLNVLGVSATTKITTQNAVQQQ